MKIACIGWGSLVWNPENLMINGKWNNDGPILPIEYARQSTNGRITLVVTKDAQPVKTLWSNMTSNNIEDCIESLRKREGTTTKNIHYQGLTNEPKDEIHNSVKKWLQEKQIDFAIWTGLLPKFQGKNNVKPSLGKLLEYFENLPQETFEIAKEYINKTPKQIKTAYRKELEKSLN